MENIKQILFAGIALFLVGCATPASYTAVPAPTSLQPPADDAAVQLAEAASAVSQSLTDLNAMEKTMSPPVNCKPLPYPTSSDLYQPVSIDWSGPIEPLLRRITWMLCDYKLRIIGIPPPVPVLVTISAKDTPVGYILRDANFQAASKATVAVYPGIHVIELRYGRT